jgi:hypothetical protein
MALIGALLFFGEARHQMQVQKGGGPSVAGPEAGRPDLTIYDDSHKDGGWFAGADTRFNHPHQIDDSAPLV